MRACVALVALGAMWGSVAWSGQTPSGAGAPSGQPPAPAQQPAPPSPRPFPEGAKIAFVDLQTIAANSIEGKAATAKVQQLNQKKLQELNEKNKALQEKQQKLQQSLTVLSDQARSQLEKEIEKMQVDIQRFTQDAQAEVQDLQQDLQLEFQRKLMPIIEQVALDKGLHMVFSTDAGIVWADRGLDITSEVIKRFDAAVSAASAPKPPKP
jgi:outer membrane protein